VPLVINARTDFYLHAGSNDPALFDEMLARCRAYVAAGADCVYPIGLSDLAQIAKLVTVLGHPVNIMGRRGGPNLVDLQAAGVQRVSTAVTPVLHVAAALADSMLKLQETGSFEHFSTSFDYARLQKLFAPAGK
jgi:2-methylisocitrate lyase-like PEP mutase family enzyme